jgi:nitroreductase
MMLQAQELGLGSLWVMHFDPIIAAEQFALAENLVPVAILMLGYAADDSAPTERHSDRQSIEQMLIN